MDKDSDSSFYYLDKAKELFLKRNDSFGLAKSLVNMAIIQEKAGDNFGSIETSLLAQKFLKEKDTAHNTFLFCNYNNLGVASNNLKNYSDAKRFYDKAFQFTRDPIEKMMLANNIAIVYHNEKSYSKAVKIYTKLLDSVGTKSEFYPKLLLNHSRSKWFDNQDYSPVQNYLIAEKLSENLDDEWTKDAAFAYLSSYYLSRNSDSARYYSHKMLALAKKLQYPEDQLEALQNLIKISDATSSQKYFDDYSRIQDSLINSQNKAKNQFALIRFESEKAKAENLQLQKQKTINEYRILRQKIINWSIIFISIIVSIFIFIRIKRRREKQILETNNRLQEQRLDFSKRVHDVVANGIYEVMTTIENHDNIPKEKLLDKLELMYEKSRDLSYDKTAVQEFDEKISNLISSFDNEKTRIIIIGNDSNFWKTMTLKTKEELYKIILELLVNMKKHSRANQVIFRFINEKNSYEIRYFDNGIGLPKTYISKNGFNNIKSRLDDMKGEMIVETENSVGLKLSIKL